MKKVYICSPCRGDYENNIQRAKEYSRAAVEKGVIPVTPHIYLTQFMDDNVPEERELALKIGSELVLGCSELWAFGIDHPSAGMAAEIELAKAHGIPVRNGFEAISELKPDEEPESGEEDDPNIGSVTIHLPAHGGFIHVHLDGATILTLADRLISDLTLGAKAVGALNRAELVTVGDVLAKLEGGEKALLEIEGFGRKSLIDLKKSLRQLGYQLPAAAQEIEI